MPRETLSNAEARRIALAAGGFGRPFPARVDARTAMRAIEQLGVVQIDSVNIVARAHEMPLWSRLGNAWDPAMLMRLAHRERKLFEYWAHEASFIPMTSEPLMRWRQQEVRDGEGNSSNKWWAKWTRSNQPLLDRILEEVRTRGPIGGSDIEMAARSEKWWGWQDERKALEWLYSAGIVSVAGRRSSFERTYDLAERVIPAAVRAQPTPDASNARKQLLRTALRACGVGTAADLADHFRIPNSEARRLMPELVEAGDAIAVRVDGWKDPAYLASGARIPRRIEHAALLSPFDPLVWNRKRAARLFGFEYRIEIYVPAPKRVHGYYVLPHLEDERIAARLDLKADRKAGVLRVLSAHAEPERPDPVRLIETLERMAAWRGLDRVEIGPAGDLGGSLRDAAASRSRSRPPPRPP
jgi:uncharacterized protein YcaQ